MTEIAAEDVVRRLGREPGYRLLTYREVGLPFWDVPLRCRLLGKKDLPALDEFVMRCVEADLRKDTEVAAFLGLPLRVVEVVMGRLVASGHLVPLAPVETEQLRFALTERGQVALSAAGEVVAEERELKVAYDGLLHEYRLVAPSDRWRPRDLRDNDLLELPAFPADPPEVGPGDTAVVAEAVAAIAGLARYELLSVLGLAGKREKFFLRALALVFQSADAAGETVVKFAIDGRPSPAHDVAFARAEGHRKLGIVGALREADGAPDAVLAPEVLRQRSEDGESIALRRVTESLERRITELGAKAGPASGSPADPELSAQIEQLQRQLDGAEAALAEVPARLLEVHEHPGLLRDALATATDRLLIVSPWIRAAVVNRDFLSRLEALLDRGVRVAIGYGIDDQQPGYERDAEAEQRLVALAERFDHFRFVRLGDTHAKVLVLDRRFVVATSFNWLSFRGDARRPFRDERGTLVTIAGEIDRIYDDYMRRMDEAVAGASVAASPAGH